MKKNKKIIKTICFIAILLVITTITISPCFGASPEKVAVFPFTMNSKDDLTFLQKGLFSMLASRLTNPGKVVVLDRETVDAAFITAQEQASTKGTLNVSKARILGSNLGVDYILFGSMTHFGDSFSIDGSMVDVTGKKPTLSFFEQSNSLGDAIPLVNTFAEDINQKIFNRGIKKRAQARPDEPRAPRAFQDTDSQGAYYQDGSSFLNAKGQKSKPFRKRFRIADILTCIATGDLDNDGQIEVVTATDNEIKILQPKGNLLTEKRKVEHNSNLEIIALDIADINKNGFPEIFVTALSVHRRNINSFVVEYDGSKGYKIIAKNEPYYYRVLETINHDKVLFAQKKELAPFNKKINRMRWENNQYIIDEKIKMPCNVSLLALAKGTIGDKALPEYVLFNESGFLTIVSEAGNIEWKSKERQGGSKHFFVLPNSEWGSPNENKVYLQPRLRFYDKDKDGEDELFVIHNIEMNSILDRYKKFVKGNIEIHSWNGIALYPISRTRNVQGWISDFTIADTDNDGVDELLVSVVESEETSIVTGSNRSYIISYDMQ